MVYNYIVETKGGKFSQKFHTFIYMNGWGMIEWTRITYTASCYGSVQFRMYKNIERGAISEEQYMLLCLVAGEHDENKWSNNRSRMERIMDGVQYIEEPGFVWAFIVLKSI